jgi:hypothetical protein
LEEKVKKEQNFMGEGGEEGNPGDNTKRELMDLAGHTGLFTVYEPKKDAEMMVPRPSPKEH